MNEPAQPAVTEIEPGLFRWTFDTEDRQEQDRQFRYWCGWFGFSEDNEPESVEGREWIVRRPA